MTQTLLDKIGGMDTLRAAVRVFYAKVLLDDRINELFQDIDIEGLVQHQYTLLSALIIEHTPFHAAELRRTHKHLNLTEADFEAVIQNINETFLEFSIEQEYIDQIMTNVTKLKEDILNV